MYRIHSIRTLCWLLAFSPTMLPAQGIRLQPGANVIITGNPSVVIHNAGLYNSGSITAANSTIIFCGDSNSIASIGGDLPVSFNNLTLANPNIRLDNDIAVASNITLQNGHLDLNGHTLDLGTTGSIIGERAASYITGTSGGTIRIKALLNAPQDLNPGNIGVSLTSTGNMGWTTIIRGHEGQLAENGQPGIYRYFDIAPDINTNLQATLRFYYLDDELNGNSKDGLHLFTSQGLNSWKPTPSNSRNTNYVEKAGLDQLHKYTLAFAPAEGASFAAQAFPNPFHQAITISFYSEKDGAGQLRLTDQMGHFIKARSIACQAGSNTIQWDIGEIPSGAYYLLFEGPASGMIKLIKQ